MPTKTQPSIHPAPHELAGLNGVLQSLFGLPFLFARRSYGDELKLHFGSERTYDHPKLEGLSRGSHVLGLRASRWRLMGGEFSGTPPTSIEALAAGTPVQMAFASAGSDGYNLAMILADMTGLLVFPNPDPDLQPGEEPPAWEDDVADWELFTPEGHLRVGPGKAWAWEPAAAEGKRNGKGD
jgi:hypothetical protein